jgi:predicted nucleotidyltransferase
MSVSDLLFPNQYRRKVLARLFMNPHLSLHLRELARVTGASAGTLKKELDALTAVGLLHLQRVGNQSQFRANTEHPVYPELLALIRKTTGLHDVLAQAFAPLAGDVELAFVFGSVASATDTARSDVDVMVIGEATFGQVVSALFEAQQTLGREINPKVMTRLEWRQKQTEGNAFVSEVMDKPKIAVVGTLHEI